MRGYFGLGQLSATEKSDILNQHKSVYNGYQTMQPQVSNTQPLYVYDAAGDKEGFVVNNKGEVKKYTNMGINEQVETKEVCDDCGAMIMDGMCECNYGHMEESELEEGHMCECGGEMYEGVCNECGYGSMEEETGHLDDIYHEEDLNPTAGFDYIQGSSNDVDTFEGMHKKLYKEQNDDDFMDYESSYTQDGVDDTDNEDDGYEDINASEVTDGEMAEIDIKDLIKGKKYKYNHPIHSSEFEFDSEHKYPEGEDMYGFKNDKTGYAIPGKHVRDYVSHLDDEELYEQGGNVDDMDVSDEDGAYSFDSKGPDQFYSSFDDFEEEGDGEQPEERPAFDFDSDGPGDVYPVNEDDMYGYDPEKDYETMESAWADEVEEGVNSPAYKGPEGYDDSSDSYPDELDEQPDISGVQGIYGAMKRAYDFDSDGPGKAGPYQEFSYESELDEEDDFEEVDEDIRESFLAQKNKINEMFNRFNKYN
jgi:hypothetical protein